jgi:hypothetical protein
MIESAAGMYSIHDIFATYADRAAQTWPVRAYTAARPAIGQSQDMVEFCSFIGGSRGRVIRPASAAKQVSCKARGSVPTPCAVTRRPVV